MAPARARHGVFAVATGSALLAVVMVVCVVVLAACSGGSGGSRPAAASSPAASRGSSSAAAPPAPASSAGSSPAATSAPTTAEPTDPTATVAEVPVTTAPAAPLGASVTSGGVVVSLGAITSVTAVGQLPGEVGGPAVRVPVTLRNDTGGPVDTDLVVVTLADAAGDPAGPVTSDPSAQPLRGVLAAGASATGTYVFTLPTDDRSGVALTVSYSTQAPVVLFTGTIAS